MRFDRLDLNLLVALDALIEERSVSQAAKRMNLSQPAISGALSRLREFFNDDILVASGRQLLLTPKAEQLRKPVRSALMIIRTQITTPARFDPATVKRTFSIAMSDYALMVLGTALLSEAAREAPNIRFEISSTSIIMQERFERGEVDLIITISDYCSEDHPYKTLFEDEHAVIAWAEGRYRDRITAEDFFDAGHAVVVFGNDRRPAFTETFFNRQGEGRRIDVQVPLFTALPAAVIGTDRLATMYRRHAEQLARFLPIVVHSPPVPLPIIREVAQWHSQREGDEGLTWLLDLCRRSSSTLSPTAPPANPIAASRPG